MTDHTQHSRPLLRPLLQLLEAELSTLKSLAEALDAEHQALTSSEVGDIEAATSAKSKAAQTHQAQQGQRLEWMAASGLDGAQPLGETIATLHADIGDAAEVSIAMRDVQDKLSELATQCQLRNRQNGVLIQRLQERARGALDVLRGADTASDIYSLSGARESAADSRSLGKA